MNEASFASLSPSLLARKGGARPAMRPQHGGMLGSIGPAPGQDSFSDQQLDDLGWNDMGDEQTPAQDTEVIKLTPSPANEETAEQARQIDEQTVAKLAEFSVSSSPLSDGTPSIGNARTQQDVLAKRIEKTSPPLLADAILASEDEPEQPEVVAADSESIQAAPSHKSDVLNADKASANLSLVPEKIVAAKPSRTARVLRVPAVDQGKRAAFTLRLDAQRHLKLRLASTIGGRSAQQIVTQALDAFLDEMPELATLAAQVTRPNKDNA